MARAFEYAPGKKPPELLKPSLSISITANQVKHLSTHLSVHHSWLRVVHGKSHCAVSLHPSLQVQLGQDVKLVVVFTNQSQVAQTVSAHLSGTLIFYTGVPATPFKNQDFTVTVAAMQGAWRQGKRPPWFSEIESS